MIVAALAALIVSTAIGAQDPASIPALAEARRLINAGQARTAVAKLRDLPPDSDGERQLQIIHLLGVAYYHADEPAKAVETLRSIVVKRNRFSVWPHSRWDVSLRRFHDSRPHGSGRQTIWSSRTRLARPTFKRRSQTTPVA